MKNISELYEREQHPVKFLQIGEGNFLRAFVDYAIDVANEENDFDANVAVVMPRAKKNERFARQNNLYTVALRGQQSHILLVRWSIGYWQVSRIAILLLMSRNLATLMNF